MLEASAAHQFQGGKLIDALPARPETVPHAQTCGSVLPFGGPKGYGIALMVEVMAAMFSGASSGPEIGDLYDDLDRPQGVGAFFTLHNVSAFQPLDQFGRRMENLFEAIKASGPADREVLIPGEIEARAALRNQEQGIALPQAVIAELEKLSQDARPLAGDNPAMEKAATRK